jgi:hypothetical protein
MYWYLLLLQYLAHWHPESIFAGHELSAEMRIHQMVALMWRYICSVGSVLGNSILHHKLSDMSAWYRAQSVLIHGRGIQSIMQC